MSPQKLEAESHPQMRKHRVSPLHLTWCLWADHALAQCSIPRPEQRKLLLVPPVCLRQAPPSLSQPSAVPAGSVWESGPFGSKMTKPAPLVLVLVPCPQQCHSELEQGVVFPDLL